MAKVDVKRTSWLRLSKGVDKKTGAMEEVSVNGRVYSYFELPEYPEIPDQDDDILYVVTTVDRPDNLAHTFYGDPRLWWVIATKNSWDQPLTAMKIGEEITIPSPRYVHEVLVR